MPKSLTTADITFQESTGDILRDAVTVYSEYDNTMIVAPTNATVRNANIMLQDAVNPDGKTLDLTDMPITKGSYDFREGDPVVITLTSYKNDLQNGTLGDEMDAPLNGVNAPNWLTHTQLKGNVRHEN